MLNQLVRVEKLNEPRTKLQMQMVTFIFELVENLEDALKLIRQLRYLLITSEFHREFGVEIHFL